MVPVQLFCSHALMASSPCCPGKGQDQFPGWPAASEGRGQLCNPRASTWPQAVAQIRDVPMAFGGNMGHRHRPRLQHGLFPLGCSSPPLHPQFCLTSQSGSRPTSTFSLPCTCSLQRHPLAVASPVPFMLSPRHVAMGVGFSGALYLHWAPQHRVSMWVSSTRPELAALGGPMGVLHSPGPRVAG